MTFDRPRQKASRTIKPNMESLGERIAPAVFHAGLVGAEHLAAWRFNAELRHHRHNLVMRQEQLVSVNGPVAIGHKPVIAGGPIQGPMLNLMVANSGSPIGKSPVSPKPIIPNHPVTLFNAAIAPSPIFGPPVVVLPVTGPANPPTNAPTNPPTNPPANTGGTLPGNVASALAAIYNEYEQNPAAFSPPTAGPGSVLVEGDQVGIQVQDGNPAEFQTLLTELTQAGMTVSLSSASYGTVIGMLPISDLLAVSQLSQTISITPELTSIGG
jgi:hypothetical protein